MPKQKKRKKNSDIKKTNSKLPLLLSIIAILISLGQFIFTLPTVLRHYDQVELKAIEFDLDKPANEDYVRSSIMIINTGENTATNVQLHLRLLQNDKILFVPEVFELTKDDNKGGIAKNLIFKCEELVPGEKVNLIIHSKFADYLKFNSLDTLYFDKPIKRPEFSYGPYITSLKHSKGKVQLERSSEIKLTELK